MIGWGVNEMIGWGVNEMIGWGVNEGLDGELMRDRMETALVQGLH